MAFVPAVALHRVEALAADGALESYHLLRTVRGDMLFRLGRREEARIQFEQAAAMTKNERERALLLGRAAECVHDEDV
jgi:predicted RNA polymerase sigma factor